LLFSIPQQKLKGRFEKWWAISKIGFENNKQQKLFLS
jgi:hypothetical protein